MDKNYVVYKLTNIINNKVYIGLSKNVKVRWSYNGIHYKNCPKIFNAINKYGWDNFKKEIIKDNLTKGITKEVKEKLEKLVGLKLEYIEDNSEV